MIRVALDRSATHGRTGIARYIHELDAGLRNLPNVELLVGEEFDLWSGIAHGLRGAAREYLALPRRVRAAGIHVYHAPASRAPARRLPVALVVTIHDFAAFELPEMQGARRGAKLRAQMKQATEEARLIVVTSRSIGDELAARFPGAVTKTRVIGLGVAPVFHRSRSAPATPVFVSVATMERRKNLTTLIDAFAIVLQRRPDARLRLIGQPQNDAAAIGRQLRDRSLAAAVSVEGYLDDQAVAAAYASATATVYPSLYEGFGLPILESMAAGTPVICGDNSALRETAGDAGLVVDPRDAGAIAAAMLRLIDDPSHGEALSQAGRERAATFSWERCAREHAKVYAEAAAG